MKKMLKNCAFISALLVSIPAIFGASKPRMAEADVNLSGDLFGAARITCTTKADSDQLYFSEINVGGAGNGDFSGTGVYLRMKNYAATDMPITMKFNSTNGAIFGPKTNVKQTYYNLDGTENEGCAPRNWGNYLMLPANFDGIIYMNYETQMSRMDAGDSPFDPEHMWRVYFEYSGFYESFADFAFGDIFTDTHVVLDTSSLDAEAFAVTFKNNSGAVQTITQGYNPKADLYGAARVTCLTKAESDQLYFSEINVGGAGNGNFSGTGVYLRMKNFAAIDMPITMKFNSTNGAIFGPKTNVKQTYYNVDGVEIAGCAPRNWGNYLMLPANFDGIIYMNYETQMSRMDAGDSPFDPEHMWRVYFEYSGFYESFADFAFGDIYTDTHIVLDTSTLDDSAFPATFKNNISASVQSITQLARSDAFVPSGDLNGGIHATNDKYGGILIKGGAEFNLSDSDLYIRIQNNKNQIVSPMLHVASHWFAQRIVTHEGQLIDLYNAIGEYVSTLTVNQWGYFDLPASFDGFIKMHWEGAANDWGTEFVNTRVVGIYIEANGFDLNIGDIFTELVSYYDGSGLYESDALAKLETWGDNVNSFASTWEILPGSKEVEIPLFDYTQIEYEVELERGVQVSAKKNDDSSVFSTASMNFAENLDLSAGEAVAISFKSNGTYAFGLELYDKDGNALMMPAPADAAKKPIYAIANNVATAINHTTGDPNTIHGLVDFVGNMVIEKDFLAQKEGDSFDWAHVASIKVRVHTHYDHGIIDVFGDIGTVDQTALTYTKVLDVSELLNWSTYFVADDEFVVAKQYFVPKASEWIGDVKIIDSLTYRDDEDMYNAINLDPGDNPCSIERKESGIKVHNGPYETGHAYGPYMCLGLFNKGATTDRAQAYKMVGDEKVYAKGLTFFAKNLSAKEIGVTLQFDEKIPGKSYTERWCIVGYPAIYYAYDINTGAEYMMYSKSDQVQIPVGFEGYIRVPFESYSVPEWNKGQEGVDEVLDLDNFSGDFFFTSDNTRYEDLEYNLKDIGMYFNETRKGNMFDNSRTIKANMGL